MKRYMLGLFSVLCMFSCSQKTTQTDSSANQYFGEKISPKDAISYDQLLQKLASQDKLTAKVKGKVSGVCQAKGCWMTIVSEDASKPSMFVKFKDYGFFMPKDIAGKSVIMQGDAFYETTSVEELRHYAEDEGLSKEAIDKITQPKKELKFLATGVILVNK